LSSGEDITERKQAEEKIRQSLREKEMMLKEIHHRVKNNLQIICSLLNWQSRYIQDPCTLEMFRESQNRVKLMALIHERLYRAKDLARINFREYVQSLTDQLFRSYRNQGQEIAIQIDMEDIPLAVDKAIPCAMILNELVSNSFKHGVPPGSRGVISISFKSLEEGRLILGVRDDGIGLPPNFNSHSADSLGWELVNALTNQIGGSIEMDDAMGTEIRIILPT
jgi:two-component sensor histidine kinase